MRAALTLAAAVTALAMPAFAQPMAPSPGPPSAADPVDPERLAMARQLFAAMHLDTAMRGMFANMFKSLPGMDAQANPRVQEFAASLGAGFDATFPELLDNIAQVYARDLTTQELKDSLAFYGSPSGQAILNKMPQIMQQAMPLSMKMMPKVAARAEKDFCGKETCTEAELAVFKRMENLGANSAAPAR
jgi:hypothetical protein